MLLPLRMASPNTGILAPKAYAGSQIDIQGTCTGPFTVVDEAPRQSLSLERNEDYWGGDVATATAEVRFVADGATRVTQLQTGEAQIASAIPAVSLSTLEGDSNIQVDSLQAPRTTVMLLNNSRPPFDDPLVRQALQHAIDLEAIAGSVYEGGAVPPSDRSRRMTRGLPPAPSRQPSIRRRPSRSSTRPASTRRPSTSS